MRLEEIKKHIGKLPRKDQDDLASYLKAIRSLPGSNPSAGSGKVHDGKASIEDLLLEEIVSFARGKGIEFLSVERLRASSNMPTARAKLSEGLEDYIRSACSGNRVEHRAFIKLAVSLVFKEMADLRLAASARTILNYIHRIPAVVNKSFPGYAASGMLHIILNRNQRSE
jgi:hypothetical protein